jgi:Tol biopolymer transport system component
MSYGIASGISDIEHQMYRLDSQAAIPINVGMARATYASWSPDGQPIAFFGNKQMRGFAGPGWVGQPYDLWLMPAQCVKDDLNCSNSLTLLLTDVLYPAKAAWSPDGVWLAFDGDFQDHGMGIWLLHVETRRVVQIATGEYRVPEWSSDGKQIVVLAPYETEPINEKIAFTYRPRLYVLDVNDLVQQNSSNVP